MFPGHKAKVGDYFGCAKLRRNDEKKTLNNLFISLHSTYYAIVCGILFIPNIVSSSYLSVEKPYQASLCAIAAILLK